MIFSILILKKTVSKKIVTCCLLVACGFFLGIDQEKALGSLSVKGVVFGVSSSIFIALTGIYTKTALDVVNKDEVWRLLLETFDDFDNVLVNICFDCEKSFN